MRPSTARGVAFGGAGELAGAREGAEEVGGSVVHEPARSAVGVHRHPANGIRCKVSLSRFARSNGGEQLYRLPDIAQSCASAGLVEDAFELGCECSRLSGDQDLAAGG